MARIYTYAIDAAVPGNGGATPGLLRGHFSVDYDRFSAGSDPIIESNLTFNGAPLVPSPVGSLFITSETSAGVREYRAQFGNPNNNYLTNLNFMYRGETPTSLHNLEISEFVLNPPNNMQNRYSASDLAVTTVSAPCFMAGTGILTSGGRVPVECLSVGDQVVTASGNSRSIRWIGHRTLDCARHPRPGMIWPVRVSAHAFGEGMPSRDLWLSPDHAVRVDVLDAVLIPVKHLINDATITQVSVPEVSYWHVELESHDILLSEGLPTESFLDTGVRAGFANAGEHMVLHPDFEPMTLDDFCLPLVQAGPILDAVRIRLIARALTMGWALSEEDDLHVVADGVAIRPMRLGAEARFALPAGSQEVRLVSRSFVPERVRVGAGDGRRLGVPLRGVSVIDGFGVTRSLPIGSDLFETGFSFVQDGGTGAWRWTTGEATIPNILWSGSEDPVMLVIETAPDQGTVQAWVPPVAQGVVETLELPDEALSVARSA